MPEPSASQADRDQLGRAIGGLIWSNPERILDTVSHLRGSDTVIECTLRGGSMGAAIPAGSMLRIHVGRTAPYRIGEVVAFVQDSGICVHRVAYEGRGPRAREFLITQGDACFYPDPPVALGHVLGPITEYRYQGDGWIATNLEPDRNRARSFVGRSLLKLVAGLLEVNVRLSQSAAKVLRIRKESAAPVQV